MIYAVREQLEPELDLLDRYLSPGDVVVDAGANCGIYTVACAKLVGPEGKVIAFEPGAEVRQVVAKNIELNQLANVRLHAEALSDRTGTANLFHHGGPVAYSLAEAGDAASEQVPIITLDAALERAEVSRLDLIKMDVEGAEELVLRGASRALAEYRPIVLFELNPTAAARFGLQTDGAWRVLEEAGYRFFSAENADDAKLISRPPAEGHWEHQNVIAIHGAHARRLPKGDVA